MSKIFHIHLDGSFPFAFTWIVKRGFVFRTDTPGINIWDVETMRPSGYSDNKTPVSERSDWFLMPIPTLLRR